MSTGWPTSRIGGETTSHSKPASATTSPSTGTSTWTCGCCAGCPGDDTGWHDHDISSGAVRVVRGAVRESNPRIGGDPAVRIVPEGGSFSFGPEHIHRLAGEDELAISIHAYSPPLWRLGQYSIDDDGVMRRASVSYADELRPLEGTLAA